MPLYIIEIMKRSIAHGRVIDAIVAGARWIYSKCVHRVQVVYANRIGDPVRSPGRFVVQQASPDAILEWASDFSDMNFDVRASAAKGALLWMIREQEQPIGFVITRPSAVMTMYYFPFPEHGSHVSYSYLMPNARGGGRFAEARSCVLEQLRLQGVQWLITNCDWWNLPARRGVERTGAREIGRGWKRRDGSRHFRPTGQMPWKLAPGPNHGTANSPEAFGVANVASHRD